MMTHTPLSINISAAASGQEGGAPAPSASARRPAQGR